MSADFEALLARSSLGTPEVRFVAALTSREDVERIMLRVREAEAADRTPGCNPSWARGPANWPEPDPVRITDLPDLDTFQEQQ